MRLIKPGLLTTVQDLGRKGYQKYGVIASGAMDHFALRCANLLVGNPEGEAVLEFTVTGPDIFFANDTLIAMTGGEFPVRLDGKPLPSMWRPLLVRGGSILSIGTAKSGVRGYLAVAGGLDVPLFMNSRSTDLRARFGGVEGRALQAGDMLGIRRETVISRQIMEDGGTGRSGGGNRPGMDKVPEGFGQHEPFGRQEGAAQSEENDWYDEGGGAAQQRETTHRPALLCPKAVSGHIRPLYSAHPVIRVLRGPHFDLFDEDSRDRFLSQPYRVLPQSDRMGYRLEGPRLTLSVRREMLSEAVTFGTVQVPSGGQPIVLLADHATTGGYPNIAQVITVDWPLLAQAAPGAEIRFMEVTLQEAQQLLWAREMELRLLKTGMAIELQSWKQWRELP